jgi:hypothetical protein
MTAEDRMVADEIWIAAMRQQGKERDDAWLLDILAAHRVKGVLAGREAMREEVLEYVYDHDTDAAIRAIPLEPGKE